MSEGEIKEEDSKNARRQLRALVNKYDMKFVIDCGMGASHMSKPNDAQKSEIQDLYK